MDKLTQLNPQIKRAIEYATGIKFDILQNADPDIITQQVTQKIGHQPTYPAHARVDACPLGRSIAEIDQQLAARSDEIVR